MVGQPRVFDSEAATISLFDDVVGSGWALLGVGVTVVELDSAAEGAARLAPTVAQIAVDNRLPPERRRTLVDVDGRLDAEFAGYRGCLVLIRPDRFVAASWPPGRARSVRGPAPADPGAHAGLTAWVRRIYSKGIANQA